MYLSLLCCDNLPLCSLRLNLIQTRLFRAVCKRKGREPKIVVQLWIIVVQFPPPSHTGILVGMCLLYVFCHVRRASARRCFFVFCRLPIGIPFRRFLFPFSASVFISSECHSDTAPQSRPYRKEPRFRPFPELLSGAQIVLHLPVSVFISLEVPRFPNSPFTRIVPLHTKKNRQ